MKNIFNDIGFQHIIGKHIYEKIIEPKLKKMDAFNLHKMLHNKGNKRAIVFGAGGFIGSHLVTRLKTEGYFVRGVDLKYPEFSESKADEFIIADLRIPEQVEAVLAGKQFDELFQLACYDDKTEVLTDKGFRLFKNLDGTEKIATLNMNGYLEYQHPTNYVFYKMKGEMYHFLSRSIDIMVTPNHNMYVKRPHYEDWEIRRADNCNLVRLEFKRNAEWEGIKKENYFIDDIGEVHRNANKIQNYDIKLFLEFLGYYLADGCCNKKKNGTYRIHIAKKKDKKLRNRIKYVVKKLGFTPYEDKSTSYGINFCSQYLYNYLKQFGLAWEKYIPSEIKELSPKYLKILFDALMICDGDKRGYRVYTTSSKRLADDFQEIALKIGYSITVTKKERKNSNWHDIYRIYFTKKESCRILDHPQKVNYNGMVYCVEVPNHIIYIRRNGRSVWCGNCDMGGAGYVFTGDNDVKIMRNSSLININTANYAAKHKVKKVMFSSSACVYPWTNQKDLRKDPITAEESAYPVNPDSEYGWEKIFSERLYQSYERKNLFDIRIARLHNVFGIEGTFEGGREKAPAALCRKVIESEFEKTNEIEIWGSGKQKRSFLYIDECIEGILRLMASDVNFPLNIGSKQIISINDLGQMIIDISGRKLKIKNIQEGKPIGVQTRTSDNRLIKKMLNWEPKEPLKKGMKLTYQWMKEYIDNRKYIYEMNPDNDKIRRRPV